ncbi:hypothetical protein EIN_202130, partial [Entamoeba invadens IP1]
YYNEANKLCVKCQTGCVACSSNGDCSSCFDGYYLSYGNYCNGYCKQCFACSDKCYRCENNKCTICYPGYNLREDGTCTVCEASCKTCSTANKCTNAQQHQVNVRNAN